MSNTEQPDLLTGIYFYFIYRKLAKRDTDRYIGELEKRKQS